MVNWSCYNICSNNCYKNTLLAIVQCMEIHNVCMYVWVCLYMSCLCHWLFLFAFMPLTTTTTMANFNTFWHIYKVIKLDFMFMWVWVCLCLCVTLIFWGFSIKKPPQHRILHKRCQSVCMLILLYMYYSMNI